MKILKVIVDKEPKTCSVCIFRNAYNCTLLNVRVCPAANLRPLVCPLQTERTCGNCRHVTITQILEKITRAGLEAKAGNYYRCDNYGGMRHTLKEGYCSRWEAKT